MEVKTKDKHFLHLPLFLFPNIHHIKVRSTDVLGQVHAPEEELNFRTTSV